MRAKDWLSEALAIHYWLCDQVNVRYMRDPRTVELVKAPRVVVRQLLHGQKPSLDCLPAGTLLLEEGHRFTPIENLVPGTTIWGKDRWSEVQAIAYKGILAQDVVFLNNGSSFRATPDHKVYALRCMHGLVGTLDCGRLCDCAERIPERISVADLVEGTVLLQPQRIAFGTEEMDPDRALIEGLYISDGWSTSNGQFHISGKDGHPKEAQKREVEAICKRLGLYTNWHERYITVGDQEWTMRMHGMGLHAWDKHALSMNLTEAAARSLLRGIMADSGANTTSVPSRTFTTTSRMLALQTRVLHRMFGISCGASYIVDHGGLGEHPIWRLSTRMPPPGRQEKRLRVKHIERAVGEGPVYDISTDDHYVYLPESDVTVSNCDDLAAVEDYLQSLAGAETFVAIVAFRHMFAHGERQYQHALAQVREPNSGTILTLDPVAGERTGRMLKRVVAARIYPVTA